MLYFNFYRHYEGWFLELTCDKIWCPCMNQTCNDVLKTNLESYSTYFGSK